MPTDAADATPARWRTLLVMRRSPDWRSLAADHLAGVAIDPARFLPEPATLGFPANLGALINTWNRAFAIDYFTCRAALKDIAARNLCLVEGAIRRDVETFRVDDLSECLVFFHDDDDWFAPGLAQVVLGLPAALAFDVLVFPLVRLWTDTVTFVGASNPAPAVAGRASPFGYRYHSNNYGVVGRRLDDETARNMREHMPASTYAKTRGFRDLYVNLTLAVTAKTPCSASLLHELPRHGADPRAWVRRYAAKIRGLDCPDDLSWLRPGLRDLAQLFEAAAAN